MLDLLQKIKDEYEQGFAYVSPKRELFRKRIAKGLYSKDGKKISTNMIANAIDVDIASRLTNGPKTKFISKEGRIGQEEANNLTSVFEFDHKENRMNQLDYVRMFDSDFFGVGIETQTGWDNDTLLPTYRVINPLARVPDPMPSQTGRYDAQAYRRHGFMMRTTISALKDAEDYDSVSINNWISSKFNSEEIKNREVYAQAGNMGRPATTDNYSTNFSIDVYHHYTIVNGEKRLFVTDDAITHIFKRKKLEPVLKEEKLNSALIPRPIALEYIKPERGNPFGYSFWDMLEDKEYSIDTILNANVLKAKKSAMGGDYLVNNRLIKKGQLEQRSDAGRRYIYVDTFDADEKSLMNAMMQLPQDNVNPDTWSAVNTLKSAGVETSKIDQMQMGIVADKTMTKAEQQSTQANANLQIALKYNINSPYYQDHAFQRWRAYQKNFKGGHQKFALLPSSFERKGFTYKKDEFLTSQIPYIMVASKDDIEAKNEKLKQSMLTLYPMIMNDQSVLPISKKILGRLNMRINGYTDDMIYSIYHIDPEERLAKSYLELINEDIIPKSLFSRPSASENFYFTCWLYLNKADDNASKEKTLQTLQEYMINQGLTTQPQGEGMEAVANSAMNINMAQQAQQGGKQIITRGPNTEALP